MTRRQAELLSFIKEFIESNKRPPNYAEIAKAMGLSSLASVHKHVYGLKAQGRISVDPNKKYGIQLISEPATTGRFEFEGPHHLWDKQLNCYWVREKERE